MSSSIQFPPHSTNSASGQNVQTGTLNASTESIPDRTASTLQSLANDDSTSGSCLQWLTATAQSLWNAISNWFSWLFGRATPATPEERVREIFAGNQHRNEVVDFEHEGHTFSVRVINNRNGIQMGFMEIGTRFIFACREDVPDALYSRLIRFVPVGQVCSRYFNSSINGQNYFDAFAGV
jgi:hypothetical protein